MKKTSAEIKEMLKSTGGGTVKLIKEYEIPDDGDCYRCRKYYSREENDKPWLRNIRDFKRVYYCEMFNEKIKREGVCDSLAGCDSCKKFLKNAGIVTG